MTYRAPVAEQLFALKHAAGIDELTALHAGELTPDLVEAIVTQAGAFAEGIYAPLSRIGDTEGARWEAGKVHHPAGFREAYQAHVSKGWAALDGPAAFGGQGLPFSLASVTSEDLGSANLGLSLIHGLTTGAVEAIMAHGSDEQRARWLPRMISGEWSGTMNLTEPHAGTDVGALSARAEPHADGTYRIFGTKIFITYGEHQLADNIVHLVLARTPGAPAGTRGLSLFIVPKILIDETGALGEPNDVRCVSIEHKMGIHASPTCVMSYGDNGGCVGEILGDEMGGMRAMFTMMNCARLNVGNQGVQVAEAATQRAIAYGRERVQSPRADGSSGRRPVPIIEHPDVRRMLVRMSALTQAARALVYHAAGQVDRAHAGIEGAQARLDLLTPLAKAYATDVGCEVASLGIQVHGGMGFIEETGAAQHYRDVRITPIYEGTNGVQAVDFVTRKIVADSGSELRCLLDQIREGAGDHRLLAELLSAVEAVLSWMLSADVNDRLAGAYPFLTMTSVLVSGWQMLLQARSALREPTRSAFVEAKASIATYYVDQVVPEAIGLKQQAMGGARVLYSTNL
jgi:alkylation response protein AidB-like acyl-CoA dehydrogenase